jgi:hypothetical protein
VTLRAHHPIFHYPTGKGPRSDPIRRLSIDEICDGIDITRCGNDPYLPLSAIDCPFETRTPFGHEPHVTWPA